MNRYFKRSVTTNIVRYYGTNPSSQQIIEFVKQTVNDCFALGIVTRDVDKKHIGHILIQGINYIQTKKEEKRMQQKKQEIEDLFLVETKRYCERKD